MKNNISIGEYIDDLASNKPTPGGGSAAALAGAMSSALTSMVFNLTVDKKLYEGYSSEIKSKINNALKYCEKYNELFIEYMRKDEEAFLNFMKAFKLPKSTEEEKALGDKEVANGYITALRVPLSLAEEGIKLYEHINVAAEYGNNNLISDAGVAAILLYASIESSIINVKINLAGIKDKEFKENVENRCNDMLKEAEDYKSKILKIVNSKIK